MDARVEGILTGKLFEYLAAERPILGVGVNRDSAAARIIRETGAGETVTEPREVRDRLLALVAPGHGDSFVHASSIEHFSRLRQAEALLAGIRSCLAARAGR
jgi:hypothetical protein